jgi:chorismate-pyruvate lyase
MRSLVRTRALFACVIMLCAATLASVPTHASETLSYSYDSLGRLVKVARAGTINNGTTACYAYDRADNRNNVTVSTSPDCTSTPPVSFSVNDVSVREGGNLVFTVTKTGTATGTLTLNYATGDGTAYAGTDYTATSGTLTFLTSDTTKTVTVPTIDNNVIEGDETALLNIFNASTGSTISDGQGVGTINDDDADCTGVSFTIASNGAVTEGANSVFTITKAGTTSYSCNVSYATASGTGSSGAISGTDFTATSGTLTFTSAQTSQTVNVPTIDDTIFENPETFTMSLSGPNKSGTLGSPSTATATINDNDACRGVTFTIASNSAVTEGGYSVFTITKTGTASGTCAVNYATSNGTAVAPGDYTAASGTLTFTFNQTSQTVSVPTIDDATVESAETFSTALSSPTQGSALGSPSSATGTINDNDSGGTCSGLNYAVSDATITEGAPLVFTVTKTGSTSSTCTVTYGTVDGTAVAPTQYTATSGTLTFTSAQTSQTVSVNTVDTSRANGNKLMYLDLYIASGGAKLSDSQGIGTIQASGGVCRTCLQTVDPGTATTDSSTSTTTDPPPNPPQ